eukprot:TRINITY_DN8167_c0_g1_i1.p1 TRINITY_DN8167_c0_g1~~TRINITY_DN8167_c0_g1_i1.p1  ORF type:complete len:498 (-),score=82.41 TRINITY_DN8167_c0_g1_i1:179-1672(-)
MIDLLVFAFFVLAFFVLVQRFKQTRTSNSSLRTPPHVPYILPWIGSLVSFAIEPKKFIDSCYKKYGDIFVVTLLGRNIVFLFGPQLASFYLSAPEDELSFLKGVDSTLGPFFPQGLFSRMRNDLFSMALATPRLKRYVQLMEDSLRKKTSKWETGELDIFDYFVRLTLHLNTLCFAGEEIANTHYERFEKYFIEADPQTNTGALLLSLVGGEKKCEVEFTKIMNLIKQVILERGDQQKDDYLQMCLEKVPRLKDNSLDYREITICIYGFLFAAQANTYAVAAWMIIHLLLNESVREDILREQKEIIETEGEAFSLKALDKMVLLGNTVLEAGRLEISGNSFRRVMNDKFVDVHHNQFDYEHNSNSENNSESNEKESSRSTRYLLPKDYLVCLYSPSVHWTPKIYSNPENFEPSRFMPPKEEHLKYKLASMLVFGGASHACLGRKFVTLELKMVIAFLLRNFEMELVTKEIKRNPRQVFFVGRPDNVIKIRYKRKKMV